MIAPETPDRPAAPRRAVPVTRPELAVLATLTLLAALLRGWKLGQLPPGIHVDEAFNLLDAQAILTGWRPIFLPANAGREVLYSYLQAPLLAAFGPTLAIARSASALAGLLSIPLFWASARALLSADPELDAPALRRAALLTAALTAFSYWHLHFSRFGIRAILFPALVCGLAWAWWRLLATRRAGDPARAKPWRASLVVALLLGLAFYTHPAGRGLVALPAAHAAWLCWRDRALRPIQALARSLTGALLIAAPLLVFWGRHPETFSRHAEETSILGQGAAALAANQLKVAGMFFVAGDPAPWRNLPGRPVLGQLWPIDPAQLPLTVLLAACFLIGLWRLLRAARGGQSWAALLVCWLLVLLVPTAVTDAAPNFSRAIGVLPLPFLLVALGFEGLQQRLAAAHPGLAEGWRPAALAGAIALLSLSATAGDYFVRFAQDPESRLAFDDDKVALGNWVRSAQAAGEAVYLSPDMARHPTVRFTAGTTLRGFDLAEGLVLPPLGVARARYPRSPNGGDLDPWTRFAGFASALGLRPFTAQAAGLQPDGPRYVIDGRLVEPGAVEQGEDWRRFGAPLADFDGLIQLLLADCLDCPPATLADRPLRSGRSMTLDLVWRAIEPSDTDLNATLQLVTEAGRGIAQVDGPPLGGTYPTDAWRPGEIVITLHRLTIPEDAPAGPALLRVGWYDWRDGTPLTDAQGRSVVEIARFEIRP